MFDYPFEKPEKVTSFTLDKKPEFTETYRNQRTVPWI
jgi:hypothetical protein